MAKPRTLEALARKLANLTVTEFAEVVSMATGTEHRLAIVVPAVAEEI